MRNLHDIIFYMKTSVLQDFHICIIVPLTKLSVTRDPFDSDIFSFIRYLFRKCCSEVFQRTLQKS